MDDIKSFVVAPIDEEGQKIHGAVRAALEEAGVKLVEIDSTQEGAQLAAEITDAIDSSDFIVVDISRQNPNVMYELGYAHGTKKNTVLITSYSSEDLPTNLMGYLYIPYDPADLNSLRENVVKSARRFIERREED